MNPRPRRAITAVELDDLLATLTPEHVAMIKQHIPVAWTDQIRAAQQDTVALIETVEQTPVRHLPTSDVDEWLRLGLLDTLIRWIDGNAKTCLHMPNPNNLDRRRARGNRAWSSGRTACTCSNWPATPTRCVTAAAA